MIRIASIRQTVQHRCSMLLPPVMVALLLLALVQTASGQSLRGQTINDELPEVAKDIGVDSKEGERITLSTTFHDEQNNFVTIGEYFDGKRPVMLSFNYSNCPKLCSVQLENMTSALREVDLIAGKDFELVSVSMDPLEQASRARQTKEKYVRYYGKPEAADGFHFLTGSRENIKKLADECGFRFKYIAAQKFYSHPPVFILLSPNGKIVRYIPGLDYEPETIHLALVESAQGKIGASVNWLAYSLGCYMFDESTGKYTFQAMALMRIGGMITVALLLITLVPYWLFRRNKNISVPTEMASSLATK